MTNYEKYKKIIHPILQRGEDIALNKDTKKIVSCKNLVCEDCLFSRRYNAPYYCNFNRMKWLVMEYTEPKNDLWLKVPIDTPVLVSNDGSFWYNRYFAGVNYKGDPAVFPDGGTSWSNETLDREFEYFNYIKLAEVK